MTFTGWLPFAQRIRPAARLARTLAAAAFLIISARAQGGQVSPDRRMVWAHAMVTFPLDLNVVKPWLPEGYEGQYAAYPLDARRSYPNGSHQLADVRSAKAAGLDAFSVDIFTDGRAANGYLNAADQLGGFQIAPCLDGGTDDQIVQAVTTYCAEAVSHRSAARVGDRLVIFTYGTVSAGSPERWRAIRERIAAQGCRTWWVADLDPDFRKPGFLQRIQAYIPLFEAGYHFGPSLGHLTEIADLFRRDGKPYAGGLMPGYYRLGGGHQDAYATATYRREWGDHLRVRPNWVHIATWNDLAENTEIMPNSDFNMTRSVLTRWYARRFRNEPIAPEPPQLIVTTTKCAYPDQPFTAEALVVNSGASPARVTVELIDRDGRQYGARDSQHVEARAVGAATIRRTFHEFPPGRFLRARAALVSGGRTILTVVSAPVLILDPQAQPGYAPLYWSVPADRVLPSRPKIHLEARSIQGGSALATIVIPPSVVPEFSEVLLNADIERNFLSEKPTPLAVPVRRPTQVGGGADGAVALPAGSIRGGTEWGFYMARVTDTRYRVGYSDPLYVPPHGDVLLKEAYDFDEPEGEPAVDASPFGHAVALSHLEHVRPGFGGKGAAVSFNGRDSRISLMLGQTPDGPMALELAVRPRAFGGMFWCDGGGMWVTTSPEGRVEFVRLSPSGWARATSNRALPLGEWSLLRCTWDGGRLQIAVNGGIDGAAPCPSKFTSWRRALGCNPFGSGSGYYDGDLDHYSLRAIPAR